MENYKELVIAMLLEIKNPEYLKKIHSFIEVPYQKDRLEQGQAVNKKEGKDYRGLIINLLGKVKEEYTLKRVYRLLEYLYLREE